jgi:hypothetical protein
VTSSLSDIEVGEYQLQLSISDSPMAHIARAGVLHRDTRPFGMEMVIRSDFTDFDSIMQTVKSMILCLRNAGVARVFARFIKVVFFERAGSIYISVSSHPNNLAVRGKITKLCDNPHNSLDEVMDSLESSVSLIEVHRV